MPAALEADDGVRVPHEAALDIIRGKSPILAFRNYRGITLRELSEGTEIAVGYLSEIERGRKPGSTWALARIAGALGTNEAYTGTAVWSWTAKGESDPDPDTQPRRGHRGGGRRGHADVHHPYAQRWSDHRVGRGTGSRDG